MYFERKIEKKIIKNIKNNDVLVLTGMRRSGKTTLLKEVYAKIPNNKIWFDFENPINIKIFEDIDFDDVYENIINKGLDRNKRVYVFIDEAQQYSKINQVVKCYVVHYDIKFVLTGSASFYLKNLFTESLAGRKKIFELFPLDFEEFLLFKKQDIEKYKKIKDKIEIKELNYEEYDKLYEEYLKWGGFPQVVLEENIKDKKDRLNEIFASYWQNEVLNLADYKKNEKVRDLILLFTARVGSKLDVQKISQELGLTRATLYSYLSFLEATYLIFSVKPFSRSVDREVTGASKLYFCDNGLLRVLANVNDGQLLENAIFNQLKTKGKINYYQKRTGQEIDFIFDEVLAFEVKQTATLGYVKNLKRLAENLKLKDWFVVSKNLTKEKENIKYAQFI